ncbi:hypothetical protein SAM23877_p075 (plasmid) [Streptomyces ambofaciens ATCC 23877]|uniref:Uncharacterized protein n=1 Tax=Streptomyces ambofaciens (strain ATCC 23877 / 3486 / DSM 40053 / JCM 4204 / NBRC 12836 / NRRL B-2516) TaxID=278992 RepID=A0A0K2B680_STRA7|nr:hypothetical protein [Streptomyces ambofaciens]AKZ60784.1 hypothetical protein SAM23877_p075 [Streptomyces ambofaciens ATCC 23877]
MIIADEIAAAVRTLQSHHTTAADLARLRVPVTRWLASWEGVELREDAALPEDAQHALAVARAINGGAQ